MEQKQKQKQEQTCACIMPAFQLFNRKLIDMLEDLASCFPSVTEFSMALSPPARMLLTMDPRHGQQMFSTFVVRPYENHIMSKDEAFLMNQESFGPKGLVGVDIVNLIKRVWREASARDKDAIWRHLHVLIVLSRRCDLSRGT